MKNVLFLALLVMALFTSCEKSLSPDFNLESQTNRKATVTKSNTQLQAVSAQGLGGAQVLRTEFDYGFKFIDENTLNVAWVNLDLLAFCNGERIREMLDIQEVIRQEKDGTLRIKSQFKGKDVQIAVYESDFETCTEYIEAEPLFKGTGRLIWNDNDFQQDADGKHANSYGISVQGEGISIIFRAVYNEQQQKESTTINIK